MELTGEKLQEAETLLRNYLPRSMQVHGYLVQMCGRTDHLQIFVDKWPEFRIVICQRLHPQRGDDCKNAAVFAIDGAILKETLIKSSVLEWRRHLCVALDHCHEEAVSAAAIERNATCSRLAVCHMMVLEDVSKLPSLDCTGVSIGTLDESHTGLVNQTWKFTEGDEYVPMIRIMIANLPSCCVLDANKQPISWILTHQSCAMGMLYTLPEHRGKGYAKLVSCLLAKKLHSLGYPVYCFIEEENQLSYSLFKNLGFSEDPRHREIWFCLNHE